MQRNTRGRCYGRGLCETRDNVRCGSHLTSDTRPRRPHADYIPAVERARVPAAIRRRVLPSLEILKEAAPSRHGDLLRAVLRPEIAIQRKSVRRGNYYELARFFPPMPSNKSRPHWRVVGNFSSRFFAALMASTTLPSGHRGPGRSKIALQSEQMVQGRLRPSSS